MSVYSSILSKLQDSVTEDYRKEVLKALETGASPGVIQGNVPIELQQSVDQLGNGIYFVPVKKPRKDQIVSSGPLAGFLLSMTSPLYLLCRDAEEKPEDVSGRVKSVLRIL